MPTILVLDDDAAESALIRQIAADGDRTVLSSENIEEFQSQLARQPVDLVIISLATICEQDTARVLSILRQAADAKVLAVAPAQREPGLTTLLRAESLRARHLLAKPIDPHQLREIFDLTFSQPVQQD